MDGHYKVGREAIVEASKAQLRMMDNADKVVYATAYGSSNLFEVALRRVGENDLAARFVDPNPDGKVLLNRISSDHNDILTAIIAHLERGNKAFARKLEKMQRRKLYMPDACYVDVHWDGKMKPWEVEKEALRVGLLERGIGDMYHGNERFMERARRTNAYKEHGIVPADLKDGTFNEGGYQIGKPSIQESIYAVCANLALEHVAHARRVLRDIFTLYREAGSKMFLAYSAYDNTASILRASGLSGNSDAQALFSELEQKLIEAAKSDKDSAFQTERLASLAFALDFFGRGDELRNVRERLIKFPIVSTDTSMHNGVYFGHDSSQNAHIVEIGLALTGLERGKPNFFYVL